MNPEQSFEKWLATGGEITAQTNHVFVDCLRISYLQGFHDAATGLYEKPTVFAKEEVVCERGHKDCDYQDHYGNH